MTRVTMAGSGKVNIHKQMRQHSSNDVTGVDIALIDSWFKITESLVWYFFCIKPHQVSRTCFINRIKINPKFNCCQFRITSLALVWLVWSLAILLSVLFREHFGRGPRKIRLLGTFKTSEGITRQALHFTLIPTLWVNKYQELLLPW